MRAARRPLAALLPVLLTVLLPVLLLAGCGVPVEDAPRALPRPGASTTAAAATQGSGPRPTTLYLVRDGALAPVTRRTSSPTTPREALALLDRGPTRSEGGQGLATALGPGAVLIDEVETRPDGVVVVPLAEVPGGSARSDEVLAYAQVVATLTSLRGVRAVSFTRDGAPLVVPRADGQLAAGPLTRRDYASLL